MCPRLQNGFSLLEFVVTLLMTVSVAWLSAAELTTTKNRILLRQETERLLYLLNEGQVLSRYLAQTVTLSEKDDSLQLADEKSKALRLVSLDSSVQVTLPERGIAFYPHLTQQPARIILSSNGAFCELVLSLRGRIRKECS